MADSVAFMFPRYSPPPPGNYDCGESQRDSVSKPWVATQELPWVCSTKILPTPMALRLFDVPATIGEETTLWGNILMAAFGMFHIPHPEPEGFKRE
jgi:hypothetical protein